MKSDKLLEETLKKTGLPVKQYQYAGREDVYIVFNEEDERPEGYADDQPERISIWWQIHLFTDQSYDYRGKKREIRKLLMDAGFTVREANTLFEKETKTMHVVLSCNIKEDMEE